MSGRRPGAWRLIGGPAFAALVLVLGVLAILAVPLRQELQRQAEQALEQDAQRLQLRLQLAVGRRMSELQQLARGLQRAPLDAELRPALEQLKAQVPAYAWLALADPEGRVLAASHGWLDGISLQSRPVFARGRDALWFGEFHPAKLLRPFLSGGEQGEVWVADVAAPVQSPDGRLRGVLVAHLNMAWLEQAGQEALGLQRGQQQGLQWALRQSDGHVLLKPAGLTLPPVDHEGPLLQAAADHTWLMTQRSVPVGAQSELSWRVLVAQDRELALAPLQRLQGWMLGLAVLALALGGLVLAGLARQAMRPYAGLLAAAERRAEAGSALPTLADELLARLGDAQVAPLLQQLAGSTRQLQRVLDHLPMGVGVFDAELRLLLANRALAAQLARPFDTLEGQALSGLLPAAAEGLAAQPAEGRTELAGSDGRSHSLSWQRLPLRDRSGSASHGDGALLLVQDLSGEVGERRRADALQRRFALLVNSALNDAFVMLDAEGRVADWSQGAAQLSGWSSEAALGRPLAHWFEPPAAAEALLAQARVDGQAALQGCRLRRAEGGSLVARGRLYRLAGEEGGFALIFSDATREQEAAQRLQDSEARLAAVIAGASDAIVSTDAAGRVLLFNPAAERIFGVSQAEMLGQPLQRLLPPEERQNHDAHLARFAEAVPSRRPMGVGKVGGLRADGSRLVLEAAISAVLVGERRVLTAILRDVTERDRAEQRLVQYQLELTELTQRLLAQEKETTRRLAQVLHDELGQSLAALRLMLDAGLQRGDAPAWTQRLDPVLSAANRQVRQVLMDLRPPLLDDQGLQAALDNELQQQQERHEGMALRLEWQAEPGQRWPADVEYAAFMVGREALGNALRHAQARTVRVACSGQAGRLELVVDDDGVGDAALAHKHSPGHLGLVGMRERALAIGARLALDSAPGRGCRVSLLWEAHGAAVSRG